MGLRELGDSVQHWFLSTLVLGALRQLYFFTVAEILVQHGSPYRFSALEERRAEVWGHPAALAVGKGGSLLVGDAGAARHCQEGVDDVREFLAGPGSTRAHGRRGGLRSYERKNASASRVWRALVNRRRST